MHGYIHIHLNDTLEDDKIKIALIAHRSKTPHCRNICIKQNCRSLKFICIPFLSTILKGAPTDHHYKLTRKIVYLPGTSNAVIEF